jgi:hypothetical protein
MLDTWRKPVEELFMKIPSSQPVGREERALPMPRHDSALRFAVSEKVMPPTGNSGNSMAFMLEKPGHR